MARKIHKKLNKEYIEILSKEGYAFYHLILIRDELITEDDIKDFSDEFKENIKMRRKIYGF